MPCPVVRVREGLSTTCGPLGIGVVGLVPPSARPLQLKSVAEIEAALHTLNKLFEDYQTARNLLAEHSHQSLQSRTLNIVLVSWGVVPALMDGYGSVGTGGGGGGGKEGDEDGPISTPCFLCPAAHSHTRPPSHPPPTPHLHL